MRKTFTGKFKAKAVLEILKEEKTLAQISAEYEVHVNQLSKWKSQVEERLHEILEDGRRKDDLEKAALKKQIQELYADIGELTTKLNWLKKNLELNLVRGERLELLDWNEKELPTCVQADLLGSDSSMLI